MFDKFGEFDSVEELNRAATGFKNEGDIESLIALAEENGIDKEDAEDYADEVVEELANVTMAAFGRLKVLQREEIDTKKNFVEKMPLQVIMTMLQGMCTQEDMAEAVMGKGKRVSKIYEAMKQEAEKHKEGKMGVSCGTDRELCEIVKAYFTESDTAFRNRIVALYK